MKDDLFPTLFLEKLMTSSVGINEFSDFTAEDMKSLRRYKAPVNKIQKARVIDEENFDAEVNCVSEGAFSKR